MYPTKKLPQILTKDNFSIGKIKTQDYLSDGDFAIVDQGKSLIGGYSNEKDLAYTGKLPVIVYGDHTNVVKYIDFPFIGGADGIKVFSFQKDVDTKYAFYLLEHFKPETQGYRRHYSLLKDIDLPLPPLSTQSRIVARLDSAFASIDEQISLLRANIVDVENMRKSTLKDALKDTEFEMKRIDSLALIMSAGGTPSRTKSEFWGGDIPWYSSGELNDLYTKDSREFITKEGLDKSSAKLFPQGTLLIGMYDTAAMKMSILDREGSCNQAIVGFFPKKEIVDVFYVKYYLTEIKEKVLEGRQGVRQKNLNLSKLKEIIIPLPPLPRQQEIVAHLDRVFSTTETLRGEYEAQIGDLETLRQSLLEEAFAGRLVGENEV